MPPNARRWDYMAEQNGRRVWCIAGRPPLIFSTRAAADECVADHVAEQEGASVKVGYVSDAGGYVIFRRMAPPKGPTWVLYQ